MTQEDVNFVKALLMEFIETQQPSELLAPDFVWDLRSWPSWPGRAVFHGPAGFMEFFAEWIGAYEDWTQELESLIDAGGGQVVVTSVQHGRLRGSDSWVDLRVSFLYTVEDGSLKRAEVYPTPEVALEAAGLRA